MDVSAHLLTGLAIAVAAIAVAATRGAAGRAAPRPLTGQAGWGWTWTAAAVLAAGLWAAQATAGLAFGRYPEGPAVQAGLLAGLVLLARAAIALRGARAADGSRAGRLPAAAALAAAILLQPVLLLAGARPIDPPTLTGSLLLAGTLLAAVAGGGLLLEALSPAPRPGRQLAASAGASLCIVGATVAILVASGAAPETVPDLATGAALATPAALLAAGIGLAIGIDRKLRSDTRREHGALAARDRRYRAILDTLDDRLLLADRGGLVTAVLPDRPPRDAPPPMRGRGLVVASGVRVWDLVAAEDRDTVRGAFFAAQAHRRPVTIVARAATTVASEADIALEMRSAEADPDVSALIVRLRDVTAEREALRATEAARRAAEEASRLKSEFLANTSHELRTPLTGIVGALDLLRGRDPRTLDRDAFAQILSIAGQSVERLNLVVENLLELTARPAAPPTEREPVSLAGLAHEAIDALRARAEGRGIALVADLDAAPGVFVDARRMRLALTNLLDNAIKFGTEGSKVTVQAFSLGDGGAELVVTDQGIGIPEDRLNAVTAPFVQVDGSSRRAHDGLGLGLAVADRVMRDHGGTVALDSRVGEGTTVRLRFPRERVAWPTAVGAAGGRLHG